jgi:hypothetical protein
LPCIFAGYTPIRRNIAAAKRKLYDMTNPEARETGSNKLDDGPADRPAGTVDEDANPPLSDPEDDTQYGGGKTVPPQDTGAAIPPYEGRTTSSEDNPRPGYGEAGGLGTKGQTAGEAATSSDKTPPEAEGDEGVGPTHTAGTGRAEDKS